MKKIHNTNSNTQEVKSYPATAGNIQLIYWFGWVAGLRMAGITKDLD